MKTVKTTNNLMPADELTLAFIQNDWTINTGQKIAFDFFLTGQVIATLNLMQDKKRGINIDLIVDYATVDALIKAQQIKTVKDLDLVTSADLWLRYLIGDGYVCADLQHIEAEVCFRIVKSITMVYSADLSFYEEIIHALSMAEQFEDYIVLNMQRLVTAAKMRSVMLPVAPYLPPTNYLKL